jgi:hypothetical protein
MALHLQLLKPHEASQPTRRSLAHNRLVDRADCLPGKAAPVRHSAGVTHKARPGCMLPECSPNQAGELVCIMLCCLDLQPPPACQLADSLGQGVTPLSELTQHAAAEFTWVRELINIWPSDVLAAPKLAPVLSAAACAAAVCLDSLSSAANAGLADDSQYRMPAQWRSSCISGFQLLSGLLSVVAQKLRVQEDKPLPPTTAWFMQFNQQLLWRAAELQLNVYGSHLIRSIAQTTAAPAPAAAAAAAASAASDIACSSSSSSSSASQPSSPVVVPRSQQQLAEGLLLQYADNLHHPWSASSDNSLHVGLYLPAFEHHWQQLHMPLKLQLALAADSGASAPPAAQRAPGEPAAPCSSRGLAGGLASNSSSSTCSTAGANSMQQCLLRLRDAGMVLQHLTASSSMPAPEPGSKVTISFDSSLTFKQLTLLLVCSAAAAVSVSSPQAMRTVISCLQAACKLFTKLRLASTDSTAGRKTACGSPSSTTGSSSSSRKRATVGPAGSSAQGIKASPRKGQPPSQEQPTTPRIPAGSSASTAQRHPEQLLGAMTYILQLLIKATAENVGAGGSC